MYPGCILSPARGKTNLEEEAGERRGDQRRRGGGQTQLREEEEEEGGRPYHINISCLLSPPTTLLTREGGI